MTADSPTVMSVRNLSVEFALRHGTFHAVDGVSFDLKAGRTLGLVGESGSGKSVTARALMQLIDPPGRISGGELLLGDTDVARLPSRGPAIRAIRGAEIAMIFQEPMSSLSPVHTVGAQIMEMLQLHLRM